LNNISQRCGLGNIESDWLTLQFDDIAGNVLLLGKWLSYMKRYV